MKRPLTFCLSLAFGLLSSSLLALNVGRDPTKPVILNPQTSPSKSNGYDLRSIIVSKTRKLAMINEELVGIGDMVGDAKILAINNNSVLLELGGQQTTIYLFYPNMRK